MELSKRLTAVAGLVTEGASVADIGTDHGYIPIYLVQNGIVKKAIALDVNRGPLERARLHIIGHGLKGQIETRLSDGLSGILPGEVDTMIAAGMGGALTIRILRDGKAVADTLKYCILQPQSEISRVRKYLPTQGLRIEAEDMVEEDGKFYPMMRAVHGESEDYEEYEYVYGKKLLEQRHLVLHKFLLREKSMKESVLRQLERRTESASARERETEIAEELKLVLQALERYRQ